jgi:hypothetical protein
VTRAPDPPPDESKPLVRPTGEKNSGSSLPGRILILLFTNEIPAISESPEMTAEGENKDCEIPFFIQSDG